MVLRCEIKLKLGDAWTAYDRMATADGLIKKMKCILNQHCEKSRGEMELLSIQGQIASATKGDAPSSISCDTSRPPCDPSVWTGPHVD
jgi:hypothetical protein